MRSRRIMCISVVLMLGASLFSACSAEESCTDGVCVSDADSDTHTVEVNSDGGTTEDSWNNIDDAGVTENNNDGTINPKEPAQVISNNIKNGNDVQNAKPNKEAHKKKNVVTPEMERYFQDLIDSGGDHARLSVLSDLLSGTKTSTPVKDMPTIIVTDKETADEHLRQSWGAHSEEQMKRDRKEEVDGLDRLRDIFKQSMASVDESGDSSDAGGSGGTAVNLANMLEELFGGEDVEFEGDDGMRDHTQKGFGAERNPCPNFQDSGKNGFLAPLMLHGYTDKNGVEPKKDIDTNLLSTNGCSMLGDAIDKDDFGLWKCCNRHDVCYGLCGSSLRFCERSFSTCMTSTCDAVDIGHDEESIIANQEACRAKKRVRLCSFLFRCSMAKNCIHKLKCIVIWSILLTGPPLCCFLSLSSTQEYRAFSRIFGSEMHSIEHDNACTCVGTEKEANHVHLDFLQDIYQRFGSSKKANNATLHENLLRKYKGMEAKLWYKLVLKYGTQKGFVDFADSPGADFGTASESKIYTVEELHHKRDAEIEQAVLALKRKKRRQMEEEYDNEITDDQQVLIDKLRMSTTAARRKYETLRENFVPAPNIPRVVDLK